MCICAHYVYQFIEICVSQTKADLTLLDLKIWVNLTFMFIICTEFISLEDTQCHQLIAWEKNFVTSMTQYMYIVWTKIDLFTSFSFHCMDMLILAFGIKPFSFSIGNPRSVFYSVLIHIHNQSINSSRNNLYFSKEITPLICTTILKCHFSVGNVYVYRF